MHQRQRPDGLTTSTPASSHNHKPNHLPRQPASPILYHLFITPGAHHACHIVRFRKGFAASFSISRNEPDGWIVHKPTPHLSLKHTSEMLPLASPFESSLSQEQRSPSRNLIQRDNILPENPPLDEPLLAVQIGGIVGAYVIFVAIVLTLLLVVGRRLRRTVQASNYTLQVEMMKPKGPIAAQSAAPSMDPSPITPTNKSHGFRSWTSFTKGGHSHSRSNNSSVGTIDHESVVAADRRRAQDQMEMLYAAVMEHDEQRAAASTSPISPSDDVSLQELSPRSPVSYQSANPFSDYAPRVPEPEPYQHHYQQQYPPPAPAPAAFPAAFPAPVAAAHTAAAPPPASPGGRSTTSRFSRVSNLSLFHSNRDSNAGPQSPNASKLRSPRFPVRKLGISSPLASPDPKTPTPDQVPLSPRFYNPAPPPMPPGVTRTNTNNTTTSRGSNERRNPPPALNLQAASPGGPGNSASSLPFRDAYPQLLSAPPTKTTILERPEKQINGPRTGLPTPYSPYMPFTPLTPLTPSRIVTKKQRKRAGKENGLRAVNEEDAVRDENDMWGY